MMDDSLLNPRERCLSDIGVAIEELLDGWRLHKLNIDFLLDPKSALLRLSAWTLQQLEELLGLLKYLTKDPDASRQLSELIGEIITPSRSPRSIEVDIPVNLQRSLVLFRPLLCLQNFAESGSVQSIQWPRLAGDPLACPLQDFNLSMRLLNSLRRHEFYCLADFVNRDEANLCSLPNFGTSSITEIRGLLSTHGLSLPFTFVDGLALPPLPKPYRSSDQEAPRSGHDPTVSPLPNEHREWQMRAHKLLALPIEGSDPEYFLNELESLTLERFTSLRPQLEEIYQLRNLLRSIDDCFHILAERHKADPLIVDVIQIQLLRRYSELLADNSSTFQWLEDSRKSLLASSSGLSALLLHLNGSSMQEIGESMNRPVSRSGVRQMFNRILDSLNIKLKDLAQRCEEQIARRNSCFRNALLGRWIEKHGRLPFHTDESLANEIPFSCEQETLVEVSLL
ncbi:MAG: hypothetical protein NTW02_01350, partial [Cyanobium sp. LacPavin_0920_WC12_MAG_62_9]|nr:hypothetical protein [Cyanobium sp. LacPavin_0920_WC12_MAG_62_9]